MTDTFSSRPVGRVNTARRAAECALVGVCWLACALPVVTASAATATAAEVFSQWADGVEPPLIASFWRGLRRHTGATILPQLVAMFAVSLLGFEAQLAIRALPAGVIVGGLLAALGAAVALTYTLMFAVHARWQGTWWCSWRRAVVLTAHHPGIGAGTLAALGVGAVLVWAFPPLIMVIGGPCIYGVCAVYLRAGAP